MEQTPIFTRLDIPTVYDTSVEESLIIEIPCDRQSVQKLNQANTQLRFVYPGDFIYYLNSSDSGFIVRLRYRTRHNNANNLLANISLSSNWFAYLFNDLEFKLGNQSIERVSHPGIVMDCFCHMENNEFRTKNGELIGFIPDTSDEVNDTIGTRQGAVAGADLAAAIISSNLDANKVVKINTNYNHGFIRRKRLHNYTVAGDDDYRDLEMFIPLNRLFSFCKEFNRVLKYIPLEIVLTRSGNNTHAFYGAANTGVTFVENDVNNSGIISITLQLERIKFRPDLESDLEKNFKKPFDVSFNKRICEDSSIIPTASRTFSHQKMISEKDEGNVRYVFCIFKTHLDNTFQTNYQRCCNADISKITIRYGIQEYPRLAQNADFSRNYFSRFYKEFLRVSASLGYMNPALSMQEFRDLYTVFAIDTSSQTNVSTTNSLTIDCERRNVPAQGVATLANPRELDAFFVIITESKIQIDCINKVIRRT